MKSKQQTTSEGQGSSIIATVEFLQGNRKVSTFMRNAGMGITTVGVKKKAVITYTPGEIVTKERVLEAFQKTMGQLDAENSEFQISCPRVLSIVASHPV